MMYAKLPVKHLFTALLVPLFSVLFLTYFTGKVEAAYTSSVNIPSSYVNIGDVHGMVMAPDGDIWYVDYVNKRIAKYDPDTNTIIRSVGRLGTDEGEFDNNIYSIAQDSQGYLYVLSFSAKVYKLDPNGGYMATYDVGAYVSGPRGIAYDTHNNTLLISGTNNNRIERFSLNLVHISGYGSFGDGQVELYQPWGLTTDSVGHIYIADEFNNRVQIMNPDYTYHATIVDDPSPYPVQGGGSAIKSILIMDNGDIIVANQNWERVLIYNSSRVYQGAFGINDGENNTRSPEFMVKDSSSSYIYIADFAKRSIKKYSSTGTFQSALTNYSLTTGKLGHPVDAEYDASGNLYVLDNASPARVLKFPVVGSPTTIIDSNTPTFMDCNGDGSQCYGIGDGPNENLAIGPDGNIYIGTRSGILRFSTSGTYLSTIGSHFETGTGNGQFDDVRGISFDASGNLFLADLNNHRIQELSLSDGTYVYADQMAIPDGYPRGVVVDNANNIYVTNEYTLSKYTSLLDGSPTTIGIGDYNKPTAITIDKSLGLIYVSNQVNFHPIVIVYNTSGVKQESFGSLGGGQVQFNDEPWGSAINPLDHTITVCDLYSSRVESFTSGRYRILNLIASANIISMDSGVSGGESLSNQTWSTDNFSNPTIIPARLIFGDYVVADFTVDLTQDRDWSAVNVLTLPWDSKSLVVNLKPADAPGISATHSLYLSRYTNQSTVNVCPSATTLAGVVDNCIGEKTLTEGGENNFYPLTSITNLDGKNYWKIDGLTGTGAFSSLFETSFALNDLMTRQQINIPSNHTLTFGTTYGLTHTLDTITIGFGTSDWNLSTILVTNLGLRKNTTDLTVASDADVDTWGVAIDNGNHEIVFTAPTNSGSGQYINSADIITVYIKNDVLLNPGTAASYPITMRLVSSDGGSGQNIEVGDVNVPIVDSDQVDITGYVNAYLNFDIDTGTGEIPGPSITPINCSFDGCLIHGGVGAVSGDNYTVDLGELKSTAPNMSNDAEVLHSDGHMGIINSIYFDLTTNAANGAIVTVSSENGYLAGPGGSNIVAVASDGDSIGNNTGLYGFNLPVDSYSKNGDVVKNVYCETAGKYCGPAITPKTVFDTDGLPVDTARVRMDIAAAASYTNNPGNYTDTLTFVATGTF